MLKGMGNLGDMAKMMAKAQEFQGKMAEAQERVEAPGPGSSRPASPARAS
jgi:hypothetical protein